MTAERQNDRTAEAVALLLPGMTLNATIFPDLGVPTVSADFTRLVVGADGWSADLASRRMGFYADLLASRLRAEPAWDAGRRIVVGHSFGGMLALAFLLARAQDPIARVDGLVLISTTAGPMFDAARLRIATVGHWEWRIPVKQLLRVWNNPTVTRAAARVLGDGSGTTPVDFRTLTRRSDLAVGLAGWRNTDWRARRSFRVAMDGFDVREQLGKLHVPAVILHGTRDAFFPLSVGEDLARRLPRAELRPVPGAAHVLPLTHPDAVARAVRDLLHPPPARPYLRQ